MERLKGAGFPHGEDDKEKVGTYEESSAKKSNSFGEGNNLVGIRGGKKTEKKVNVIVNEMMA